MGIDEVARIVSTEHQWDQDHRTPKVDPRRPLTADVLAAANAFAFDHRAVPAMMSEEPAVDMIRALAMRWETERERYIADAVAARFAKGQTVGDGGPS
jgi:hypothetical protein